MRPKQWFAAFAFVIALGATEARAARTTCPNIVGVWNSWASGLFGKGDTTFRSDGTAIHGSGIRGVWKCEGGKIQMSWGGETPKLFTLQGGKLVDPGGIVGFSREGGAQASRSETGAKEERETPSGKQRVAEAPKKNSSPRCREERAGASRCHGRDQAVAARRVCQCKTA